MILNGIVTYQFWLFCLGIKESGLVHISQLKAGFVRCERSSQSSPTRTVK
jgi:predicted RNA-binding protein with RPS1 domain